MSRPRTHWKPVDFIRYELKQVRARLERRLERERRLVQRMEAIRKGEA
jgi:hypothetical protein